MQEKQFTQEPATTEIQLQGQYTGSIPTHPITVPPIVAIAYPAGETAFPIPFLQQLVPDPALAWIIMEYGNWETADLGQAAAHLQAIRQHTTLPVIAATQDTLVEAGHVYWVSQGFSLQLIRRQLVFRATNTAKTDNTADLFLAALAAGAPQRHAVLLSPGVADRAASGLHVVRAQGGFSFVVTDDPPFLHRRSGSFLADFILPAAKIAATLQTLLSRFTSPTQPLLRMGPGQAAFDNIGHILVHEKGFDSTRYPPRDIGRCLHRRMGIHGVDSLEAYTAILKEDIEELGLLCDELSTTLSGFFLEPAMESALEKDIFPALLSRRNANTPLRIWLPRCIGGQPAYAVAMRLLDHLQAHKDTTTVQIFATDLNKAAIDRARTGIYDTADIAGLSSRRQKRYFVKKPDGWHIHPALREICVFATQNLLRDPPFSHVDLIIGCSTLVGLNNSSVERAFRSFHYALNPRGFLLPGRMRSRDYPDDLFQMQSEQPFIFVPREVAMSFEPVFQLQSLREGEKEADKLLLAGYVPAALLIDEQYKVVRFYGDLEPYLRRSTDRPSLHVLRMVRDDLVFELNELIEQSDKQMRALKKDGISLGPHEDSPVLSLEVAPVYSSGRKWRLIVIREMPAPAPQVQERPQGRGLSAKDLRILALEDQLNEMRGLLLAANQDAGQVQQSLEQANEEIMASNEELQSVNEQLQSVNEQLLSFNVELNTVNEDLHNRNRELELSVEYVHAVIASLHRPLVVLYEDGRIRTANPSFGHLFNLDAGDLNSRPLFSIGDGILDREPLRKSLRQLQEKKLATADLEIKTELPGRGDRILAISAVRMQKVKNFQPGIVLAIEDITQRRIDEQVKDDFIGIASHELKTPAATIQAYSQLLFDELAKASDLESALLVRKLSGQVTRLTRLTRDLLDVTGIGQGLVLHKEFFDIHGLIKSTVEEMQVITPIRLVIVAGSPLPPIRGDKERIGQVLVNLLSNAIKYAQGTREIIIRTGAAANQIWVSVQDFGIGMSPESLKIIFDRFCRLDDPSSGRHPGVGLGLYISAEIVRRHGGEITATSEKEKGSIFTIHLPIR